MIWDTHIEKLRVTVSFDIEVEVPRLNSKYSNIYDEEAVINQVEEAVKEHFLDADEVKYIDWEWE